MTPRLKSLTVRNFRSVRGEVHIPLDAPVVLIHGANGAGKTSILSALELALTGEIASFARMGRGYDAHLMHKEAAEGHVSATVDGLGGAPAEGRLSIGPAGASGRGLLSSDEARLYVERCFLSQASLGRLLEIYQLKDAAGSGSPLTRFVKDLLHLDRLDALIDGLHDSGNVKRLRVAAPAFWTLRTAIPGAEAALARRAAEHGTLRTDLAASRGRLNAALAMLGIDPAASEDEIAAALSISGDEADLQRLAGFRREIVAAREQWLALRSEVDPAELARAEADAEASRGALDGWAEGEGATLGAVLAAVSDLLPATTDLARAGSARAWGAAHEAVTAELARSDDALRRDEAAALALREIEQGLERARARATVLEDQIGSHTAAAGDLAQALSAMLPHVHTDDCPVCGRDFTEVSESPLQMHVSTRLAELTEGIGRLQSLSRERAESVGAIAAGERSRREVLGRRLADAGRLELTFRRARLGDLARELEGLRPAAANSARLAARAAEDARRLVELRGRGPQLSYVRSTVLGLAGRLDIVATDPAEPLAVLLDRVQEGVSARNDRLLRSQADRIGAAAEFARFRDLDGRSHRSAADLRAEELRLERLRFAFDASEGKILQARRLATRARDARTAVVRRVFNEALNAIWRDLFIRLAPEEPFVPAFALPESSHGPVEAVLETRYRSGGQGGDPRAMLSAGNLNTAALTLFLALHLSVAPTLPWLVIDDPVQSMDEVHIAQFAALLRTLSKQHGRQVIVAVHERPLFEYLALELSPAFAGDRLLTVELGRSPSGETTYVPNLMTWAPDCAVAA